jgi:mevalonate kinase
MRDVSEALERKVQYCRPSMWVTLLLFPLQELVDMNQALLNVLGVSHPALDRICKTASKFGLHAKLTGAGGGGYAFVLLPVRPSQQSKVQQMKEQLQRKGFVCVETELGSAGITVSNVTE